MKAVVWFPVEPLLLDLRAYLDAQLRRDGNQAGIEELVEVRPKEYAVRHLVYSALGERPDVLRFEDREGALAVIAQRRWYASVASTTRLGMMGRYRQPVAPDIVCLRRTLREERD